MEIWGLIKDDHRKLQALLVQIDQAREDVRESIEEFTRELIAHTEAEEKAIYPVFRTLGGFKEPVARAIAHDRKLRGLVEEFGRATPHERPSRARWVKAALAKHVEQQEEYMLHVAHKELSFHVAEHMKHEFKSAKHAAAGRSTRAHWPEAEPTEAPLAPDARASAQASAEREEEAKRDRRDPVVKFMKHLLRRENGNVFVYQAAIDRLAEPAHRSLLGELVEDHHRHADELGGLISAAGHKPPTAKDAEWLVAWAKVSVAGWLTDKLVLKAMRSNEEHSRLEYERILRKENPPAVASGILRRLAESERRHRDRIDSALNSLATFNRLEQSEPPDWAVRETI